jgi:ferredoxin
MNEIEDHLVVLETPEGERSFRCKPDEFIWDAAARNGIVLPAICHQGRCLTCACRVLSGIIDQASSNSYFPEDKKAGFALICTGKPQSDLHLRTHQQWKMREHRSRAGLPAPYS